jgi:hypothetical protein
MTQPFTDTSEAAFAIIIAFREGKATLTRKAGSFVGETIVDDSPLSEKQEAWLQTLLVKAGLPPLVTEGGH